MGSNALGHALPPPIKSFAIITDTNPIPSFRNFEEYHASVVNRTHPLLSDTNKNTCALRTKSRPNINNNINPAFEVLETSSQINYSFPNDDNTTFNDSNRSNNDEYNFFDCNNDDTSNIMYRRMLPVDDNTNHYSSNLSSNLSSNNILDSDSCYPLRKNIMVNDSCDNDFKSKKKRNVV
jgi:hypothetical protein